jgi:hypothetical protein
MRYRTIPYSIELRAPSNGRVQAVDDKQLAKLVKKTVAKASKPKVPQRRTYDSTLDVTRRPQTEQDTEAAELFEQMKKREF